ncbi:MAG TPA: efflux RND transporter permease subunit [Opitutaceae bacterium]|nr:efflux RND transporter permease subunit [Opitutaceae bacterium]
MHFTDIFIKRPVLATVISLLILLIGFRSIELLNVRQYPRSDIAVVTVTTVYVGASADLIRGFITTPLEREIASADGIDYMESSSGPSVSLITVHLRLNYDPNAALTQITSKVNRVRNQLPADAQDPVIDVQMAESTAAMYLMFSSDQLDSNQITDYLYRVVQPKLTAVAGVQSAQILGARIFAMRIWLKPDKLAAYGLSPSQVWQALATNNYLSAVGATKGTMISVNLNVSTDLHTADEFRRLVIREQDNAIIRLGDVADVVLGAESYEATVKFGGNPTTAIAINVLPTANALTVINDVRKVFPQIVSELPRGVYAAIPYDATDYIRSAIDEVVSTLVEALLIVIVIIYLFLGTVRSVVIPIVAMPLSLIGACFLMLVMGFTINLLTLLAMVLAIGLVVDDAIVVVENIHRHIEEGLSPLEASLKGARELGGPVIAMTITLAAVYAPIGFQGGLTGALFREFAFTLAGSVIVSGVVALTLSPMMCSKLLKHDEGGHQRFAHFLDRQFDKIRAAYEHLLNATLNYRPVVVVFALIVFASLVPFYQLSKTDLAPDEDQGMIIAIGTAAANANIDQLASYSDEITGIVRKYPETAQTIQISGYPASNNCITLMALTPWDRRQRTTMQLLPDVTQKLGSVAGMRMLAFLRPPLPGAGGANVQFVVVSTDDPARIAQVADSLVLEAFKSGMFFYADSNLKFDQAQAYIDVDRDKAAALGVSMAQLGADLGSLLGGNYVNFFNIQGRSYRVVPQVDRVFRLNPDQLGSYYVSTGKGRLVPLSTLASVRYQAQPQSLNRFQQLNAATLTLVPKPGVTQGQALDFLNAKAREIFPEGYSVDYGGQSRQFVQESGTFLLTLTFAIIIIFLVLAAQFESFRDPLIIMLSVPLAVSGALAFICVGYHNLSLNIYTKVGLITLVGLVTKHGILITQFANQLQREGRSRRAAVEEAAGVRLRPILMTTAAMVLGVLPLVLASGAGAVSRQHMGLIIATGMSVGTLFTLFVVPTAYTFLARDHHADREKFGTPAVERPVKVELHPVA